MQVVDRMHVVIAREGILERDLVHLAQKIGTWNTLISGYVVVLKKVHLEGKTTKNYDFTI